jgi:hypothetical protein
MRVLSSQGCQANRKRQQLITAKGGPALLFWPYSLPTKYWDHEDTSGMGSAALKGVT